MQAKNASHESPEMYEVTGTWFC